jgi:flagellar motor switch protein FliN/FliY
MPKMGDMLSQDEINALLGGVDEPSDAPADDVDVSSMLSADDIDDLLGGLDIPAAEPAAAPGARREYDDAITNEQKDILGEIGNISMGTAATTLYALLNQKVLITTPKVHVYDWESLSASYDRPCVAIRVSYKEGIEGSNILILKDRDVKIIADLMMGGTGEVGDEIELTDLDMSAIGEAMNQMVGSSSTSLSSIVKKKIDIDTPQPFILDFKSESYLQDVGFEPTDQIVCISFKMEIGTLIDSEIMQILPIDFAKDMVDKLWLDIIGPPEPEPAAPPPPAPVPQAAPQQYAPPQMMQPTGMDASAQGGYGMAQQQTYAQPGYAPPPQMAQPVNVQPAVFQNFDVGSVMQQKENMGIIMDVPLEVTVELGRTRKTIQEILEFAPGTVVELNKLAGEPIDILVNGKYVAKGEVVVIDENFGIRITEIVSVEKRI